MQISNANAGLAGAKRKESHGAGHAQDREAFQKALDSDTSDEAKALKTALGSLKPGEKPSQADRQKIRSAMAAWKKTPAGAAVKGAGRQGRQPRADQVQGRTDSDGDQDGSTGETLDSGNVDFRA